MRNIIKKLFVIFSISIFASCITVNASAAAERFWDVPVGSWCYSAIDYAVGEHLFDGMSATIFSPHTPMTRGMFVKVLGNKARINLSDYARHGPGERRTA